MESTESTSSTASIESLVQKAKQYINNTMTQRDIENIKDIFERIMQINNTNESLKSTHIQWLGKKGIIPQAMRSLSSLDKEDKKVLGAQLNTIKEFVVKRIQEKMLHRKENKNLDSIKTARTRDCIDVTLPVRTAPCMNGGLHPLTIAKNQVISIFCDLGFSVEDGPEIETEHYNFTMLNFSKEHPARAMHDTFYLEKRENDNNNNSTTVSTDRNYLLRTHTSPVQIRVMEKNPPPLKIITVGRTYRADSDSTHTPQFHQIEGLVVNEKVHIGYLTNLLKTFLERFFNIGNAGLRLRPSYFPFTSPSFEVDVQYQKKNGTAIALGQGEHWMEILGCGMVHPNVLRNVNIDPNHYQGCAFGIGLDRLAMLQYQIHDLRFLFEGEQSFMQKFNQPFWRV